MDKTKNILKWILGIVFLLFGIIFLVQFPIIGIIIALIGLFVLPPTFKIIEQKTKYTFTKKTKWIIVGVGFCMIIFGISNSNSKMNKQKADILVVQALKKINNNEIDSAMILINEAKVLYESKQNEAIDLHKEIKKINRFRFRKRSFNEYHR